MFALMTVGGTAIVQAYNFGVEREHQRNEFVTLKNQIGDVKATVVKVATDEEKLKESLVTAHSDATEAARTAAAVAKDLADGRARTLPRIDALEASQRLTDVAVGIFTTKLDDIKSLASANLEVSKSHSEAINATRNVVAPKEPKPH